LIYRVADLHSRGRSHSSKRNETSREAQTHKKQRSQSKEQGVARCCPSRQVRGEWLSHGQRYSGSAMVGKNWRQRCSSTDGTALIRSEALSCNGRENARREQGGRTRSVCAAPTGAPCRTARSRRSGCPAVGPLHASPVAGSQAAGEETRDADRQRRLETYSIHRDMVVLQAVQL